MQLLPQGVYDMVHVPFMYYLFISLPCARVYEVSRLAGNGIPYIDPFLTATGLYIAYILICIHYWSNPAGLCQ